MYTHPPLSRREILSLKGIGCNQRHSMDINKQYSPLLSFTPEIRNGIYEFTLGGADIHISCQFSTVNHSLCKVSLFGRNIPQAKSRTRQRLARPGWVEQHAVCIRNRHGFPPPLGTEVAHYRRRVDFSLLWTCKQIHQEAAVLPFTLNTFIFSDVQDLHNVARYLPHSQKHALTSIALRISNGSWRIQPTPPPVSLDSLRLLMVSVLAFEQEYEDALPASEIRILADPLLDLFAQHRLDAVSVEMYALKYNKHNFGGRRVREYPSLAREYERRLLRLPIEMDDPQSEDE